MMFLPPMLTEEEKQILLNALTVYKQVIQCNKDMPEEEKKTLINKVNSIELEFMLE